MSETSAHGNPGSNSRVGNRIRTDWDRTPTESIEKLRGIPTAVLGDAMGRMGAMSGQIRPLWRGAALLGTVLPVWVRTGDNLKIHHALALARPGDVLVVNGQGSLAHGLVGELMATSAAHRGVRGLVIDGAVRDIDALETLGFSVFGRGVSPAGPSKEGTGEVGYAIACGGIVCCPGDAIVGDADGVVVVPQEMVEQVGADARAVLLAEQAKREAMDRGDFDLFPLPRIGTDS